MGLRISLPILTVEINNVIPSDTEPMPEQGYEIVLLKDLGYTKLWVEVKIS